MMLRPAMTQIGSLRPRNRQSALHAMIAVLVAMAALAVAATYFIEGFREMSGSTMVVAAASALVSAMAVMVGIHSLRFSESK